MLHSRAAVVAEQGGWTWRKPATLTPGDVQFFAGRKMTVHAVGDRGRTVVVAYEDHPAVSWPRSTEVAVLDA